MASFLKNTFDYSFYEIISGLWSWEFSFCQRSFATVPTWGWGWNGFLKAQRWNEGERTIDPTRHSRGLLVWICVLISVSIRYSFKKHDGHMDNHEDAAVATDPINQRRSHWMGASISVDFLMKKNFKVRKEIFILARSF